MPDYPIILGVYSFKKETQIGLGETATKRDTVTYWYVRQLDKDLFETQPLNIYHVPSGVKQELSASEFLKNYFPEPHYYKVNTVPALTSLTKRIAQGEKLFSQGQLSEAEKEFIKALMIDDLNVKATYGVGKVASEQKDYAKLNKVLNTLLNLTEAFSQEYREQFNGFGITLRKNQHYDNALRFYSRALELNALDEHVYFNMARAYFEKGAIDDCICQLNTALSIAPEFDEARKFLNHCQKMKEKKDATPVAS
jgi:tetratricopeptide (TPR) repeat protein